MMNNNQSIHRFGRKFSINLAAVVIPGIVSILAIPFLFRITTNEIAGTIMWTWFLGASASAINVGLVPSLTNNLGAFCKNKKKYNHLLLRYIKASNSIFFTLGSLFLVFSFIKYDFSLIGVPMLLVQIIFVWLTGLNSLVFTALNYESKFKATAIAKLVGNTMILVSPILAALVSDSKFHIISSILLIKVIQTILIFQYTNRNTFFLSHFKFDKILSFLELKRILTSNKLLIIITFLQFTYSFIDRSIVMLSGGAPAYAEYGAILDILTKVWLIANIFIIILHPALSDATMSYSIKIKTTIYYTKLLSLATIPFLLMVILFTEPILMLIFNTQPVDAVIYSTKAISLGLILSQLIILLNVFFIATKDYKFLLIVTSGMFVFYVITAYPVFQAFGIKGLATMLFVKFFLETIIYWGRLLLIKAAHERSLIK